MTKHLICLFILVMLSFSGRIALPVYCQQSNAWQGRSFSSASELIQVHQQKTAETVTNDCYMVVKSGEYILNSAGKANDIQQLLKYIPALQLNAPQVIEFVKNNDGEALADAFFMLQALKSGATFDEARDGITITTQFPERPLNQYDYDKLEQIFSSSNTPLQAIYLDKMKFMFGHHGCTPEMAALERIIRKKCATSEVKEEILALYQQYERVYKGAPAPQSTLYTIDGKTVTIATYKGKMVIIDVWATWCCSCLEKMPEFTQLQKKYNRHSNIIFLSLSIDHDKKNDLWKKTIEKHNMQSLTNLIAPESKSSFCNDYFVSGVPRYIVINPQGEIINAFASLDKIEQIIQNTLK
ncbi:MAG: TlpA family protein disulfide reductase [Odoribacter splanchnicus]